MASAAAGEHVGILGTELSCTIDHTKVYRYERVGVLLYQEVTVFSCSAVYPLGA